MFASGALRRAVPLVAVLSSLTFAATASAEALRAAPAASFVDSVGVNIHPIFLDTAYKDQGHRADAQHPLLAADGCSRARLGERVERRGEVVADRGLGARAMPPRERLL